MLEYNYDGSRNKSEYDGDIVDNIKIVVLILFWIVVFVCFCIGLAES